MKPLLVFDFDGVLAIPWINPEQHFPQIPHLLSELSKSHSLCVASFNPRAELAIRTWGLDHHFASMRSGKNSKWSGSYCEEFRKDMSKSGQILNMVEELGHEGQISFFDDDSTNVSEVEKKLPYVKTILIKSDQGVTLKDI